MRTAQIGPDLRLGNMGRNVEIILLLNRRCPLNMGSAYYCMGVHLILACARLSDSRNVAFKRSGANRTQVT